MTLYNFLKNTASVKPNYEALATFDYARTFDELLRLTDGLSSYLHELGVTNGDKVSVILGNVPEAVIALFAASRLGAYIHYINPALNVIKIKEEAKNSRAVLSHASLSLDIPTVICGGGCDGIGFRFPAHECCPAVSEDNIVASFASGTDRFNSSAILALIDKYAEQLPKGSRGDEGLTALPVHTSTGLIFGILTYMFNDICITLAKNFYADIAVYNIRKKQIGFIAAEYNVYEALLSEADFHARMPFIKSCVLAGTAPPGLIAEMNELLDKCGSETKLTIFKA